MGRIEESNRRKLRRGKIQKVVLQSVKAVGFLSIALLFPNALKVMKQFGIAQNKRQSEIVKSSARKLTEKGLLAFKEGRYQLTKQGEQQLRLWELEDYKLPEIKKWDKKWRVIIFDIPEYKMKIRHQVRSILISAGFYRLQDSVWVSPIDCEDVIGILKTDLGIEKDLLYMLVDELENDKHLLQYFNVGRYK